MISSERSGSAEARTRVGRRSSPADGVSLKTSGLGVSFGGHHAVSGVTTEFRQGTLTAIVGPNGAGKTTFFNLVSGQIRSTSGQVWLMGEDISSMSAASRTQRGLGRAFQLTNLFPKLSVLENIRLAVQSTCAGSHRKPLSFFWSMWNDHRFIIDRANEMLEKTQLERHRHSAVAQLSHGDQRKLEVAMLMALEPSVYMFDEPTAGMTLEETPVILDLIRKLSADPAKTIILVEHKMDVVRELANRILVMHDGKVVADGAPEDVIQMPEVQVAYLGNSAKIGE